MISHGLKMSDLEDGEIVFLDDGFTCVRPGAVMIHKDENGLHFWCQDGKHYLDGQKDDNGYLIGISKYWADR